MFYSLPGFLLTLGTKHWHWRAPCGADLPDESLAGGSYQLLWRTGSWQSPNLSPSSHPPSFHWPSPGGEQSGSLQASGSIPDNAASLSQVQIPAGCQCKAGQGNHDLFTCKRSPRDSKPKTPSLKWSVPVTSSAIFMLWSVLSIIYVVQNIMGHFFELQKPQFVLLFFDSALVVPTLYMNNLFLSNKCLKIID